MKQIVTIWICFCCCFDRLLQDLKFWRTREKENGIAPYIDTIRHIIVSAVISHNQFDMYVNKNVYGVTFVNFDTRAQCPPIWAHIPITCFAMIFLFIQLTASEHWTMLQSAITNFYAQSCLYAFSVSNLYANYFIILSLSLSALTHLTPR